MRTAILKRGRWRGKKSFFIALEEGRTCPSTCGFLRSGLCGASNFFGYRHIVDAGFFDWVDFQIRRELRLHPLGIVIRLHVSGDFVSTDYVRWWGESLAKYRKLCIWGHTHHTGEILRLITGALNDEFSDRALIRASENANAPHCAIAIPVIGRIKDHEGTVCPATLTLAPEGSRVKRKDETALSDCGRCGACMDPEVKKIIWPLVVNGIGHIEPAAHSGSSGSSGLVGRP